MERRIGVSPAHSRLLEDLVSSVGGEQYSLFETKQKALMFAAALGFHLNTRTPLDARDASTAIRFDIFEKNLDDGYIACLGIASLGDLGILGESRRDELATIFEEYASAGLSVIQHRVIGKPNPLQALVSLILDNESQPEQALEGVDPSLLAKLLRR